MASIYHILHIRFEFVNVHESLYVCVCVITHEVVMIDLSINCCGISSKRVIHEVVVVDWSINCCAWLTVLPVPTKWKRFCIKITTATFIMLIILTLNLLIVYENSQFSMQLIGVSNCDEWLVSYFIFNYKQLLYLHCLEKWVVIALSPTFSTHYILQSMYLLMYNYVSIFTASWSKVKTQWHCWHSGGST